jgi:uncharacterized protein (TIGR01244 family)
MFRQLDEKTLVGGQISAADMEELKRHGVTMIVNNRPDGEDPGQPTSREICLAAEAAGIAYRHVPIVRGMGPTDIEAMRDAMHEADEGKLLAYCRSGNRSTLAWAVAKREDGAKREELEACAEAAGFSLAPIQHLL